MILSKVRKYIAAQIKAVDSKFKEIDAPFIDSISESRIDKAYHIKYDVNGTTELQTDISDSITAEVRFYFKSFKRGVVKYDYAMDVVNSIRMKCININSLQEFSDEDQNKIVSCHPISQVGEQLGDNGEIIEIILTLDMNIYQAIC